MSYLLCRSFSILAIPALLCCSFLAALPWLFFPGYSVLTDFAWLLYPGYSGLAALFCPLCPGCFAMASLSWLIFLDALS
jgi:hypothetical protein